MSTPPPSSPVPVPPSHRVLRFPQDHYLHPNAPSEWWWHTGTLTDGDRTFGFEINAAGFAAQPPIPAFTFTQVMLADVKYNTHFQQSKLYPSKPADWAESDSTKEWYAKLGDRTSPDHSFIEMRSPHSNPSRMMHVEASLTDKDTQAVVTFDLQLVQNGPPFIVYGTGVSPYPPDPDPNKNNYYYSLTRLEASGTITIQGKTIAVKGMTWMDHQYGLFGSDKKPVNWFLQDMQLANGVHISNSNVFAKDNPPQLDKPSEGYATIQFPDDTTYLEKSILTPTGRTWTGPTGTLFYMEFRVEIPSFGADFYVNTLMDAQDFPFPEVHADTYEGVAVVQGKFSGQYLTGTAWNEQNP